MWTIQAILIFLKLVSSKYEISSPALFTSLPMEYKGEGDWYFMAKKTIFVSSFHEISWWVILVPFYLIIIRYILNLLLNKRFQKI